MPQRIAAELQALASEARRKHPDVRHAAEDAAAAVRDPHALGRLRTDSRAATQHPLLAPLLLAFATRSARVVLTALTALHRGIVVQALPEHGIPAVLGALHELVATHRTDVDAQLKILQIASALLTQYKSITAEHLSATLMLCFDLYEHARVAVVTSTAAATLRQNIMTTFDKVVDEDVVLASLADGGEDAAAAAPLPVLTADTPDGTVELFPCAADAYRVLADLKALANGESATFLPLAALSRTFVLELLESVLTSHAPLFSGKPQPHPELLYVLRSSICPLLLKSLSDPPEFPVYVRTMRLVLLLLQRFSKELVLEIEILLRMLLRMISCDTQEPRPHWHRILALEVVNALCADGRFTRRAWLWYDAQEHVENPPTRIFSQLLNTLHQVTLELAPTLDRDPELVRALEDAPTEPAAARDYSTLYGAAAGVASAAVAGMRTATEGLLYVRAEPLSAASAPGVPLIDQLDKPDAPALGSPALPQTYLAHLAAWSQVLLAQTLAHFVHRRLASAAGDALADADGAAALGMLRASVPVTCLDLAFMLTVRCSDYLFDQVLVALANMASAASAANLCAERDRIATALTRLALAREPQQRSLACAAAVSNMAMPAMHSGALGDGWVLVLECLCLVGAQLGPRTRGDSDEYPPVFFPAPGTAADELRGAPLHLLATSVLDGGALQRRIAAVFARSTLLSDAEFDAFCSALARLAESSPAAERAMDELDGVIEQSAERLAAQRPGGTWHSIVELLFAVAGDDDVPAERRLHAGHTLDRLFYAALRTGGTDAQQRAVVEGIARQAEMGLAASSTVLALRRSALELMLRILETHAPRVRAWDVVFAMCSSSTHAPAPLVKAAFACIQLVCTDHLDQLDDEQLRMCVACIPRFSTQVADMNIALAANGMLWEITTEIQHRDAASRVDLWLYLLSELSAVARVPNADVRNGAIANLFQLLLQFSGSLGKDDWVRVVDQVLFPLLASLEHGTLEWRASRVLAFQGIGRILSELLVPVFADDEAALASLQRTFFAHVGRAARMASPDVAQASLDALLMTLGEEDAAAQAPDSWIAAAAAECTAVAESLHSASTLAHASVLAQVLLRHVRRSPQVLSGSDAPRTVEAATKCLALGLQRAEAGSNSQLHKLMATVYAVLDGVEAANGSRALVVRGCTAICSAALAALDAASSRPLVNLRTQLAIGALDCLDAHLVRWLEPPTLYCTDTVLEVLNLLEQRIGHDKGALWERHVHVLCVCARLGALMHGDARSAYFERIVALIEGATAEPGTDDAHDAHVLLMLATLEAHVLPAAQSERVATRSVAWLVRHTALYSFAGISSAQDAAELRQGGAGTRLPTVPIARERVAYWSWDACIALALGAEAPISTHLHQLLVPHMAAILSAYVADCRVHGACPMPRVRVEEVLYIVRAVARLAEHVPMQQLSAPLFALATLPPVPGALTQKGTCGTSLAPLSSDMLPHGIPEPICARACAQHSERHAPAALAQQALHTILAL